MVAVMDALELTLGGGSGSPPGTGWPAMSPHDPDWLLPLGGILVALFAIGCIMLFVILRWGRCREHHPGVSMFEHECLVASLAMVLLLVLSLASLYYYFCYRGGCFGGAMAGPAARIAGRKAKMMSN